jgi:hypothetical protein
LFTEEQEQELEKAISDSKLWIQPDEAVEFIQQRENCGAGYAHKLLETALASREVHAVVDNGEKWLVVRGYQYSQADEGMALRLVRKDELIEWFDRHRPQEPLLQEMQPQEPLTPEQPESPTTPEQPKPPPLTEQLPPPEPKPQRRAYKQDRVKQIIVELGLPAETGTKELVRKVQEKAPDISPDTISRAASRKQIKKRKPR